MLLGTYIVFLTSRRPRTLPWGRLIPAFCAVALPPLVPLPFFPPLPRPLLLPLLPLPLPPSSPADPIKTSLATLSRQNCAYPLFPSSLSGFSGPPYRPSRRDSSYDTPIRIRPSPLRCQGGKIKMQARLLLSHDNFSLEKKPIIWRGCGGPSSSCSSSSLAWAVSLRRRGTLEAGAEADLVVAIVADADNCCGEGMWATRR